MVSFTHLKRCLEIGERDIAAAVGARDACRDLFTHLAAIAKPKEGAPKILLVFGRLATEACTWREGDLRVEITGDEDTSVIQMMEELGPGLRERIFPAFALKIPLSEIVGAIERAPGLIEPLTVGLNRPGRVVFVVMEAPLESSPPPAMRIDEGSIFPPPPTMQPANDEMRTDRDMLNDVDESWGAE